MGVPACWGLRPPRDSTPCPRHWFGLFGLRPMGEAVAGLDSLQPGGGGETELDEPSAGGECGAPPEWWSLRLSGRGAPLPANPCSFVAGHHVFGGGWASGKLSVVLRSPRTLVPPSRGTTSLGSDGLTARRGRMGVPACWGLRPPRDSTPCPRHWFGLFGLRPMGEAVAGLDSLQPGGAGARRNWMSLRPGVSVGHRLSGGASG